MSRGGSGREGGRQTNKKHIYIPEMTCKMKYECWFVIESGYQM